MAIPSGMLCSAMVVAMTIPRFWFDRALKKNGHAFREVVDGYGGSGKQPHPVQPHAVGHSFFHSADIGHFMRVFYIGYKLVDGPDKEYSSEKSERCYPCCGLRGMPARRVSSDCGRSSTKET